MLARTTLTIPLVLLVSLASGCVVDTRPSTPPVPGEPGAGMSVERPPPPPPPLPEAIAAQPGVAHQWVVGSWSWSGRGYVWHAGHWERPPYPYTRWEKGHWEPRGDRHVWVEGQWRR